MLKWLKKKIEINNRRNMNDDTDPTGLNAWTLSSFIIMFIIGLSFLIAGVLLGIFLNPYLFALCLFGGAFIGWMFWHLCRYYGKDYDNKK